MRQYDFNYIDSKVVGFMINDICNMACTYCYQQANNLCEDDHKKNRALIDKVLDYVVHLSEVDRPHQISIEGGEPFFDTQTLEYFFTQVEKKLKQYPNFYSRILIVTNGTKRDNIKYIIDKFDFSAFNVTMEVSLHYTQMSNTALKKFTSNVVEFKKYIEYVRVLAPLSLKKLPKYLNIILKVLDLHDVYYFFAPIVGLNEINEIYDMSGFPFKGEVDVLINGETKNINAIYDKSLTTDGMVCENNQCFFFYNTGDIKMFSCINNRETKNIFKDSFDDIFQMDKRTICTLDYCMDCNLNTKYEMSELDPNNKDDADLIKYYIEQRNNTSF